MRKCNLSQAGQYMIAQMQPIVCGRIESRTLETGLPLLAVTSPEIKSPCPQVVTTVSQINDVKIRRGRVGEVCLYEITESELEELARGTQGGDVYLNFSTFCISTGLSILLTLITSEIKNDRLYSSFIATVIVMLLGGGVLLVVGWKSRTPIKGLISKIKMRVAQDVTEREQKI